MCVAMGVCARVYVCGGAWPPFSVPPPLPPFLCLVEHAAFATPAEAKAMRAAEKIAKDSKLRVWKDYVPKTFVGEREFVGKVWCGLRSRALQAPGCGAPPPPPPPPPRGH